MKCDLVQENLGAYCAGELSGEMAADVEQHLSECAACAAEARKMAMVIKALGSFEMIEPRADFRAGVWARIGEFEARKRLFWVTAVAAMLARNRRLVVAGCLVFVVSLFAGLFGFKHMTGGRPVEVATDQGAVSNGFVMREIPENGHLSADTVYTHFVTGDRPVYLTSQPRTYLYKPVTRPASEKQMTF
jgi:anti-sigma factor RsiW